MAAICNDVRQILAEAGLLPDAHWRNFMACHDIMRTVASREVRSLVKKYAPHLNMW